MDLVDSYPCRFIYRLGVQALESEVALHPGHEERLRLMNPVKAGKVYIRSIHDVDGAGLDEEFVENIDVVNVAMGNADHHRDIAPQVQQRRELHGGLALAELRPREDRQTEVDDCRIEGVDRPVEFQSELVAGVQFSGGFDQHLGEVGVDASVAGFVGVGQGVSGDFAPDSHVVELGLGCPQARFDVSETLLVGHLRKGHAEELVPAGKGCDLVIAVVALDALAKLVGGNKVH